MSPSRGDSYLFLYLPNTPINLYCAMGKNLLKMALHYIGKHDLKNYKQLDLFVLLSVTSFFCTTFNAGRENMSSMEEALSADVHGCSPQAQIRFCI